MPQDAFEIDFLRRAIDWTIGVDVAGDVLARESIVFAALTAEIERFNVGNDEVVALARHDQVCALIRFLFVGILFCALLGGWLFHFGFKDTALIRRAAGQDLFAFGDFDTDAFVRRTGLTIDNIDQDLAVLRRLFDHR